MEGMIDITGADLTEVVKAAYDLSAPQGLGHFHYTPEPLTDDEANSLVDHESEVSVSLDYVKGRACKFNVWSKDGKLFIRENWFDHSPRHVEALLERITQPAL